MHWALKIAEGTGVNGSTLSQLRDDSNIDLKNEQFVDVMKLRMKTSFTFQGQPYEQIKGTPMG